MNQVTQVRLLAFTEPAKTSMAKNTLKEWKLLLVEKMHLKK